MLATDKPVIHQCKPCTPTLFRLWTQLGYFLLPALLCVVNCTGSFPVLQKDLEMKLMPRFRSQSSLLFAGDSLSVSWVNIKTRLGCLNQETPSISASPISRIWSSKICYKLSSLKGRKATSGKAQPSPACQWASWGKAGADDLLCSLSVYQCLSSPFRGLHTTFCQSWGNILMWLSCPWVVVLLLLHWCVLNSTPPKKLVFSFCFDFCLWLCRNVAGYTRTAMEMAAWQ